MALSKEELLKGRNNKKTVTIEALEDGDVEIRPLTDGEFYEIQAVFVQAVEMNIGLTREDFDDKDRLSGDKLGDRMTTTVDVGQFAKADHQANVLAAKYGLSVTVQWTDEEVESLPPGSAEQIAKEVYDFSGAHPEQEVMLRHFRDDGSRPRDRAPSDDGGSVGDGTELIDTGSAHIPGRSRASSVSDGGGNS